MRRLILIASLVIPSVAAAQGAPPPPPDPNAPPPMQPQPPPPPPQGGYYQQPQYAPQPMYQQPPSQASLRNGMTFEANLGIGWMQASDGGSSDTSDVGIAGLSLGIGGWASPQLAITGRLAGVTLSDNGARLSHLFLGPSAQYWVNDNVWLGGGIGYHALVLSYEGESDSVSGFGFDLRAGYTFNLGTENTFNASLELTPGRLSENNESITFTGIGLLLGYQHL